MALSWEEFSATVGQSTVAVNIAYLDKADIHLEINDVEVKGFTWISNTLITIPTSVAISAGDKLGIIRRTNRAALRILFSEGAAFTRDNLDEQNDQFLYLAQELVEGRSIEGFYGDIDMNGCRITDLGTPVDGGDAANKSYVDTTNSTQDSRLDTLEGMFTTGYTTAAYPYYAVISTDTTIIKPNYTFSKAQLFLNGVHQIQGTDYNIIDNNIIFTETVRADSRIYAILGEDIVAGDGIVSAAQLAVVGEQVDSNTTSIATLNSKVSSVESTVDNLESMAYQDSAAVDITGGSITGITPLAIADGGTGSKSAIGARTSIGAAVSGSNNDITSLTGLTTPLSVSQGGTGFPTRCFVQALTTTVTSLTAATISQIAPTKVTDTLNAYSGGDFIAPRSGYYHIRASARLATPATSTTGSFGLTVALDATTVTSFQAGRSVRVGLSASKDTALEVNCLVELASSQIVRVFAYQDHTAALNLVNCSISIIQV